MMTKEEIKVKEDRLGELYLTYYRLLMKMNDLYLEHDKVKLELTNLAKEIEEDYLVICKEKENGEELRECE